MLKGKWFVLTRPVPISVLRNLARGYWSGEGERPQRLDVLEQVECHTAWARFLGLPVSFFWLEDGAKPLDVVSPEVIRQIVGQRVGAGIKFTYAGQEFVVIEIGPLKRRKIGDIISARDLKMIAYLSAVRAEEIDLHA